VRISSSTIPNRSGDNRTASAKSGPHTARTVGERAPVLVGAPVQFGRQELADQVAMGAVQFDPVEAGLLGALRGGDEVGHHLLDLGGGEGPGAGLGIVGRAHRLGADECCG
jgi:hypothetical protein